MTVYFLYTYYEKNMFLYGGRHSIQLLTEMAYYKLKNCVLLIDSDYQKAGYQLQNIVCI